MIVLVPRVLARTKSSGPLSARHAHRLSPQESARIAERAKLAPAVSLRCELPGTAVPGANRPWRRGS